MALTPYCAHYPTQQWQQSHRWALGLTCQRRYWISILPSNTKGIIIVLTQGWHVINQRAFHLLYLHGKFLLTLITEKYTLIFLWCKDFWGTQTQGLQFFLYITGTDNTRARIKLKNIVLNDELSNVNLITAIIQTRTETEDLLQKKLRWVL